MEKGYSNQFPHKYDNNLVSFVANFVVPIPQAYQGGE
jgi:hypothetical protein